MLKVRLGNTEYTQSLDVSVTTIQAETYRLLLRCAIEKRRATVQYFMDELGIQKVKTFLSRLDHLQQKGLISYSL